MTFAIKEVSSFASDIDLRSLIVAAGRWKVETITITGVGSGALSVRGFDAEISTLTGLTLGAVVTIAGLTTILAAGTSVASVRVAFGRK